MLNCLHRRWPNVLAKKQRLRITSKTIASFLVGYRWHLLLLGSLVACGAVIPATRLDYDRRIECLFAPDDPLLIDYLDLKQTFGGNELVLAVYEDPELFHMDGSGIDRLASIRTSMESVAGVSGTLTLDQLFGAFTTLEEGWIVRLRNLFEGYTHGADQRTVCVVCMLDPSMDSQQQRANTVRELRQKFHQLPAKLSGGIVTGEPVMMVDAYRYVEKDSRTLSIISTVLSALVIFLSLRSLRWVIIALVVVHTSLLSTKAILSLAGFNLSLLSATLTAMITVIGIATTIHILVHYKLHLATGASPDGALTSTLEKLLLPIFWTCTTDAVGFCALCLANVTPIREYGIMMGLGSMLVFVSTCLFVPGLALVHISTTHIAKLSAAPTRRHWPHWMVERIIERPGFVVLIGLLIGFVSILGFIHLETETDFTRNFRSSTPIVQSYQEVETRLGGAGAFDVILPAPEKLDWKYLVETMRLENKLRKEVTIADSKGSLQPALTKVISLADAVVAASPKDIRTIRRILRQPVISVGLGIFKRRIPEFIKALHAPAPGNTIDNATQDSYTLTQDDVETTLSVTASYTDSQGTKQSMTSAAIWINDSPAGQQQLFINGIPKAGEVLAVDASVLAEKEGLVGGISYQWNRNTEKIYGATQDSYTLIPDDVRTALTVTAGYTDSQGTKQSVTSAAIWINDSPTSRQQLFIHGIPKAGEVLSVDASALADKEGMVGGISYQWNRDGGNNQYLFRIMLRTHEQQTTAQKTDIIRQVRELCGEHAKVTGYFVLLTNIVDSVMRDQWSTMVAAIFGIFLVTMVAFRSPLMAMIGLIPSIVPIVLVMGTMGWLGLKINLGGAMIAAVSLGLSIDSAIHFIYSYHHSRSAGTPVEQALREAAKTVGQAMVLATLALIAGFVVLCASPFVPTIYFGILVSLAMLGGLLGNLLVLPALIKLVNR